MLFTTPFGRRLRLSIGAWMVLISLLALLPLAAFSLYATKQLVAEHHEQAMATLERRAGIAGDSVGRELQRYFAVLHTLAASDAARSLDLPALHEHARRVLRAEPGIGAIQLVDRQGTQWFETSHALGEALPPAAASAGLARVFDERAELVVPLVTGASGGAHMVGLAVPVVGEGRTQLALGLSISPQTVGAVLNQHRWPADWTATVIDQNGRIVAHSRDGVSFVGQPVSESLRRHLGDVGGGVFESITKDGVEVVSTVAPVGTSGWHVAVGRPAAALRAEMRDALLSTGLAGLVCMLLAAGGSFYLARELGKEIRAASVHVLAGRTDPRHGPVREVAALAAALGQANSSAAESARRLEGARLDALTGLPGRALLQEQASGLLGSLAADPARRAALLFVDLDGFKAVNDRMGHEEGDRVLVEVASVLRRSVRERDLLGRLGGDEFVVVMDADAGQARDVGAEVAQRIVSGVAGLGRGMGCSVGLAFAADQDRLDDLLRRADAAMLAAKRAGRNRVQVCQPA